MPSVSYMCVTRVRETQIAVIFSVRQGIFDLEDI